MEQSSCIFLTGIDISESCLLILKKLIKKYIHSRLKSIQIGRDKGKIKLFSLLRKNNDQAVANLAEGKID